MIKDAHKVTFISNLGTEIHIALEKQMKLQPVFYLGGIPTHGTYKGFIGWM